MASGKGESQASVKRVKAVFNQSEALKLRMQGKSFPEIARLLGYSSASGAHKAVISALQKTLQEPATELRKLESERLDALLEAVWDKAISEHNTFYVDRALAIMDRRAKLLGLDMPTKIAPTDPDGKNPYESFNAKEKLEKLISDLANRNSTSNEG